MPLQMNIISGAEIRAKSKSGMTSDQIAKELLNSPTRDEVKPSEVAQLKAENEKLKAKLEESEDSVRRWRNWTNEYMKAKDKFELECEDLKEENEKLKKDNEKHEDILVSIQDELLGEVFEPSFDKLKEEIKELKVKANAWDIHYKGADWEYASQSWDKAQCQELIECGACTEEDFEFHEEYNRSDNDKE